MEAIARSVRRSAAKAQHEDYKRTARHEPQLGFLFRELWGGEWHAQIL